MLSKDGLSRAAAPVSEPRSSIAPAAFARRREPLVVHGEFDADPSRLRENLEELAALLQRLKSSRAAADAATFGELVARWRYRWKGQSRWSLSSSRMRRE